jgi:hypothetical protein
MIIRNRLGNTFGPFGSNTGFFMLIGGLAATYYTPWGILIAVAGAFAAFTSSVTVIDTDKKKIRYSDNLWGIIPFGKWQEIRPDMKLGLKRYHRGYVGYIRGTQPVGIHEKGIRIILCDSLENEILPVMKCDGKKAPKTELENLCRLLGLTGF